MRKTNRLRNYFWSFANSGGTQIIGFVATILIARIATPSDFGLIAICSSIVLISNLLSEAGLSSSIVVNKEFSKDKASTILVIVSSLSLFLFFLIVLYSADIANFFNQTKIGEILPYMALTIIANGFRCVHSSILLRNLEFKKLTVISLVSVIIGSSIGVIVAYNIEPLIGLVLVYTLTPLINTIFLWLYAPWGFYFYCKPNLIYSDIKFSLNVTISSGFDQVTKSAMVFLLNGRFGIVDLGFYSRADAVKNLASQTIDKIVQRVNFPVLSKKNHESPIEAINEHIKVSFVLVSILIPLSYFLFSYTESIINILYGPNWLESAVMLKKIAFLGLFATLTSQNLTFFKAIGRPSLMALNKGIGLLLLPFIFLIIDSPQILEILNGFVIYAATLFVISFMSLIASNTIHIISYFKYVFIGSVFSVVIILVHYYILSMPFKNIFFNIFINGASLLSIMCFFYYGLFLLSKGFKNVKS